jgi:hypothetical protein
MLSLNRLEASDSTMSHKHNLAAHQIWIFLSITRYSDRFTKDRRLGTQGSETQRYKPISCDNKNS